MAILLNTILISTYVASVRVLGKALIWGIEWQIFHWIFDYLIMKIGWEK